MWLISVTSFLKIAKLSLDLILNLIGVLIITSCDFLSFMVKIEVIVAKNYLYGNKIKTPNYIFNIYNETISRSRFQTCCAIRVRM